MIDINNVLQLHYLATTFQVPYLIDKNNSYMHEKQEEVLKPMFQANILLLSRSFFIINTLT